MIQLGFRLIAGHAQLVGIDHDDEIAGIHVRGVNRLVLATQTRSDLCGQTTQHLICCVYQKPVVLDFLGFSGKCFHSHNS
jgi:hypothetical protein